MPVVSLDSPNFPGLLWTFKLLPGKHRDISIWYARPFASMFYRPAYVLLGQKRVKCSVTVVSSYHMYCIVCVQVCRM